MEPVRTLVVQDEEADALLLQEALAEPGPVRVDVSSVRRFGDALDRLQRQPMH